MIPDSFLLVDEFDEPFFQSKPHMMKLISLRASGVTATASANLSDLETEINLVKACKFELFNLHPRFK